MFEHDLFTSLPPREISSSSSNLSTENFEFLSPIFPPADLSPGPLLSLFMFSYNSSSSSLFQTSSFFLFYIFSPLTFS